MIKSHAVYLYDMYSVPIVIVPLSMGNIKLMHKQQWCKPNTLKTDASRMHDEITFAFMSSCTCLAST